MKTDKTTNAQSEASQGPTRTVLTISLARVLRHWTRPIVTLIFAAVIAQAVIEGLDPPQWFLNMAMVVILEWWGERAITRLRGKE